MPTPSSDVPLDPSAQTSGDPTPVLGGGSDEAPVAADPSLDAAADDLVHSASTGGSATPQEREIARLRAQVDLLLNDPFDEWVERIQVGGVTASGFESTLSWRVTKPLRLVRTFQLRVQQLGLLGAVQHTARYAKRRLSGRAR